MDASPNPNGNPFPLDGEGIWCEVLRPPGALPPRPALFLDRDGVVVEEVNYLSKPEDVRLVPGAAAIVAAVNRRDIPVVLITNQSGIGRGLYGWDAFAAVQRTILDLLTRAGARVDAVYACPHYPDHPARKPNPGMLLRAEKALRLDMRASWAVGDRASDLEAAQRAGLAGGVHVLSGHGADPGERTAALALAAPGFKVATAPSVAEAAMSIPLLAG
ncbi:MAG: HAD family hydrolase [Alphaproteobacteria bacterium]|nr:HAD family hydrolase [Alphaproteobacteria bacterium]MBM3950947.1 HAD family hydrolase [Rhodospirillales bacterium]